MYIQSCTKITPVGNGKHKHHEQQHQLFTPGLKSNPQLGVGGSLGCYSFLSLPRL